MIVLRSAAEIETIRQAGRIAAATLACLRKHAKAGVKTIDLDTVAREEILRQGGYPAFKNYKGFPGNICASVNNVVVHGIPSGQKLREGDILSVDVGVHFRDYYADAAATFAIGAVADEARRLIDVTREALHRGIDKARGGGRLSDISAAIQEFVEDNGFSVVRALVGHGIGANIHEEPEIPNFGRPGRGPRLEAGMVLAIEPMVNAGTYEVETKEDGWAVVTADGRPSAHFEHTVVVRDEMAEILTEG